MRMGGGIQHRVQRFWSRSDAYERHCSFRQIGVLDADLLTESLQETGSPPSSFSKRCLAEAQRGPLLPEALSFPPLGPVERCAIDTHCRQEWRHLHARGLREEPYANSEEQKCKGLLCSGHHSEYQECGGAVGLLERCVPWVSCFLSPRHQKFSSRVGAKCVVNFPLCLADHPGRKGQTIPPSKNNHEELDSEP